MKKLLVRRLSKNDASAWYELRLLGLKTDPYAFASSYEEEINDSISEIERKFEQLWSLSDNFIIGCFESDQLISTAALYPERLLKRNHIATIWAVYTHPQHRGKGAAKLVIQELLSMAKTNNSHLTRIGLSVESLNQPAIKLYQHFGFKAWGIEPQALIVDGKSHDECYMSLDLSIYKILTG